ncbi:helix-turn-helix domain-containing protein [Enterococcus faecalis]|uniref:helix-turn-helix domain-containing protein n=1 Tax=Enterococcus faecalis TaxID=1351 RepID=UPI00155E7429|nr:helix-turn-helix transcriptional regulator [Enterococcus faecalis]MDT2124680.1 helix-turn-helix transcriptional regulator [Enterococcus faecalis]NRC72734.1 helix-turn-helix transcriptional regulator [Enterococcus faecalis]
MNLNKQIKKYREEFNFSQEELAKKLFVSRQTISNWENERSYPDIHNLLLLSVLFDVSLDELVKGDVEKMKEKIANVNMDKYTKIMIGFSLLFAISIGPSLFLPNFWWIIPPFILWSISMYAALKIEKIKKDENIQTFKEIVAFSENKDVAPVRELRNKKKDLISKFFIVTVYSLIFGIITLIMCIPFILSH